MVNGIVHYSLRKVKYRVISVLTSKVVQETIASILDSLKRSDLEDAKRKIQALAPEVKSERQRGELLAAAGIYASMAKAKEGTMQSWDMARVERAAKSITLSQLSDEFDVGYAETLVNYSRLSAKSEPAAV
jgi:hypothetical protein